MSDAITTEMFEQLRQELRRGSLVLAVLAALQVELYGYTLRKTLADEGLEIEESTLYPLLRRLETQGMLTSQWREEGKREKRFYRLSAAGEVVLGELVGEWSAINTAVGKVIEKPRNTMTEGKTAGEKGKGA